MSDADDFVSFTSVDVGRDSRDFGSIRQRIAGLARTIHSCSVPSGIASIIIATTEDGDVSEPRVHHLSACSKHQTPADRQKRSITGCSATAQRLAKTHATKDVRTMSSTICR